MPACPRCDERIRPNLSRCPYCDAPLRRKKGGGGGRASRPRSKQRRAPQSRGQSAVGNWAVIVPVVMIGVVAAGFGVMALVKKLNTAREQAVEIEATVNSTKKIGLALHHYHEVHAVFPPGAVVSTEGVGQHGWATALLPQLEQVALYNQVNFHVPWNHSDNLDVMRTQVPDFRMPGGEIKTTEDGFGINHFAANMHAFGKNSSLRISAIRTGTSNTIAIGECGEGFQPWGKPGNWRDPGRGINGGPQTFGHTRRDSANFLMFDGSTRQISATTSPDILKQLSGAGQIDSRALP